MEQCPPQYKAVRNELSILGKLVLRGTRLLIPAKLRDRDLAPVVQRLDIAIHQINHYPADSVVCFVNTYPLDSDLSGG